MVYEGTVELFPQEHPQASCRWLWLEVLSHLLPLYVLSSLLVLSWSVSFSFPDIVCTKRHIIWSMLTMWWRAQSSWLCAQLWWFCATSLSGQHNQQELSDRVSHFHSHNYSLLALSMERLRPIAIYTALVWRLVLVTSQPSLLFLWEIQTPPRSRKSVVYEFQWWYVILARWTNALSRIILFLISLNLIWCSNSPNPIWSINSRIILFFNKFELNLMFQFTQPHLKH